MSASHHASDAAENSETAERLIDRAAAALSSGDPGQAAERLRRALAARPEHGGLYWRIGNLFLDMNRPDDADDAYEAGLERFPGDLWLRFFHARAAEVHGRWPAVVDRAARLLDIAPDNAHGHRLLATGHAALGAFDVAEAHSRRSVAVAPDDCWALHYRAELALTQGDAGLAIARFQALAQRLPEHAPAAARLSEIRRRHDRTRAERLLEQADQDVSGGRRDEALAALRTAAALCPGHGDLVRRAAFLFQALSQPEEAEAVLASGIREDPRDAWLLYFHAHAAEMRSDWPAVIERAARLRDLVPTDSKAHRLLATAHAALGALDVAEAHSRRSVELAPDDCWALHYRAELALTQGRPAVAVARFQELATAFPNHTPGYRRLEAIVAAHPDDTGVAEALRRGAQAQPENEVLVLTHVRNAILHKDPRRLFDRLRGIKQPTAWYRAEYHHLCFKLLMLLHDDPQRAAWLINALLSEEDDGSEGWRPQILVGLTATVHIPESPVHHVRPVVARHIEARIETRAPCPQDSLLSLTRLVLGLIHDEAAALSCLKLVVRRGHCPLLFLVASPVTPNIQALVRRYRAEVEAADFHAAPPTDREMAALLLLCHHHDPAGLSSLCRTLTQAGLPAPASTLADPAAFIDAVVRSHTRPRTEPEPGVAAPFLSGRRPLRIALCVSGQLRGFRKARPSWARLGLERHSLHCFVHVWKNIGWAVSATNDRGLPSHFRAAFAEAYATYGLAEFHRSFPSFSHLMDKQATVTEAELRDVYGTEHVRIEDDETLPFSALPKPERMYHKISACYELAKDSGKDFDLIIRMRPDREVVRCDVDWNDIRRDSVDGHRVHVDPPLTINPLLGYVIGDQFAVGCPSAMQVYSKTHQTAAAMAQSNAYGFPREYAPHTNLAHTLLWNGVSVALIRNLEFGEYFPMDKMAPTTLLSALRKDIGDRDKPNGLQRLLLTACEADVVAL